MARFLALVLLLALPLRADRVRVVVAVGLPEVSAAGVSALRAGVLGELRSATRVQPWGKGPAFAAEIDRDELERLRRDPRVRAVALDEGGGGALIQSIPLVRGDLAHAAGRDGRGVTIAILDSGIDLDHPDFAGRIVGEQCFCDNYDGTGCCPNGQIAQSGPGSARDDAGHGTHVAGIAAGGGAVAPAGLAPAARIVAVRVMDRNNAFQGFTQVYRGLEWIAANRPDVRVINMSLGTFALYAPAECDASPIALGIRNLVRTLRARGVLITASSGNLASLTGTVLPACMTDVLGVGATYDATGVFHGSCTDSTAVTDGITCFTNSTGSVDLVAPGAQITATARGGGAVTYAGTSMAAPHVAGTIALMIQANGMLGADAIEQILETTGKPVTDTRNGLVFPRIDAGAAVAAVPPPPDRGPRRRSARH